MDTLSEAMRRAAQDAPLDLGERGAADVSWSRGRRRRLVARAGAVGTVVAAVLLVAGVVLAPTGLPRAALPAGEGRVGGVSTHPQRIGSQWWVRELPASGTPVALLVRSGDDPGGWQAVDASGTRYRLPGGVGGEMWPAVSADGTRVGYVGAGDRALYRVLDLRTGHGVDFPDVGNGNLTGDGHFLSGRRYGVGLQMPGFFSPDGARVAVTASTATGASRTLVLALDGTLTEVRGLGLTVGWLDDDRLLARSREDATGDDRVDLVVWDRRTGRTAPYGTVTLSAVGAAGESGIYGQWGASIRGDGTLWLRGSDDRENPDGSVTSTDWAEGFALPSLDPVDLAGRRVTRPAPVEVENQVVQGAGWAGTRLVGAGDVTGLVVLAGDGTGSHPVVDDAALRWDTAVWAQDALDGGPTWSPFGTSTSWFAWRWKELALGALALGLWRLWWRRRLRTPAPARASAATSPSPAGR